MTPQTSTSTHAETPSDDTEIDQDVTGGTPRSRRWPRVVLVGALVLVGAGVGAVATGTLGGDGSANADGPAPAATTTATVERRDIVSTTTVGGTLTYQDETTVSGAAEGTITWVPEVGATIKPGQRLFEVDGEPVVLISGGLPLWRELSVSSAPGKDVRMLERSLDRLGYADALALDLTYTWATANAVAAFREASGLSEGSTLGPEDVVVSGGPVRVAGVSVQPGDQVGPGAPVLTTTGTAQVVAVDLDPSEQGLLTKGDPVSIDLPDGSSVDGSVTYLSPVAEARTGDGQEATTTYALPAEITLEDAGKGFDQASVDVHVTDEVAADVLAVPVEAVLALAEGGYALEVLGTGDRTSLVAVTLGDFADGWVEVTGDGIAEGAEVVSA